MASSSYHMTGKELSRWNSQQMPSGKQEYETLRKEPVLSGNPSWSQNYTEIFKKFRTG